MADPELQIRGGGGHPDPEISGGWSPKKFFAALRASVWSTNKCVCVCVCVCVGGGSATETATPGYYFVTKKEQPSQITLFLNIKRSATETARPGY